MAGGESLWRANWSERADPFADVARGTGRGPGWQRAAGVGVDLKNPGGAFTPRTFSREPTRRVEAMLLFRAGIMCSSRPPISPGERRTGTRISSRV